MPIDVADDVALSSLPSGAILAPTTSAQRGLWLIHLLDSASCAYHVGHAFRITGSLSIPGLRSAFRRLVARHDALRTSFAQLDHQLYQVVHPVVDMEIPIEDVRARSEPATLVVAVRDELERPFDLAAAPLLRVRVFAEDDLSHVVTVVAHHIVVDARSIELMWSELAVLYENEVTGSGDVLDDPELQYTDYASWESDWLHSDECAEHVQFFGDRLRDAPAAVDLPLPRRAAPPWRGGVESVLLPAGTTEALLRIARSRQATAFMATLTLFAAVLYRWSDQPVVVVGTQASLRDEPGLAGTVGMLVNSIAVPTFWGDDPSFVDALDRVRAVVLECVARQRCPFDHLVTSLRPPRDGPRSPVFQVYCGHSTALPAAPRLFGVSVAELDMSQRTAKFELTLDTIMVHERLRCDLEWSAQRFDATAVRWFGEHLRIAAEHAARDPEMRVGEWPLEDVPDEPEALAEAFARDDRLDLPWIPASRESDVRT